jgi:hypothetical protein
VTDFVGLSRAARTLPGQDTHDRLWAAWFGLPTWHFVKAASPVGWLPFSTKVQGQQCTLGFTGEDLAAEHARRAGIAHRNVTTQVLSLAPEATIRLIPKLRTYGVIGLVVNTGPDAFYAPLDALPKMLDRYRPVPVGMAPAPPPLARTTRPITVDQFLALPAWHLAMRPDEPNHPELAARGSELVAHVYSARSGSRPTVPMAPRDVLALLADLELVQYVCFDDGLEVELVDLQLAHRP